MTQAERSYWKLRKGCRATLDDGRVVTITGIRVEPFGYKKDRVTIRHHNGGVGAVNPESIVQVEEPQRQGV